MSRQPQSRAQAQATGEHDDEPQNGLPEALPAGERLLWQGSPDWRVLARHGFHFNAFVASSQRCQHAELAAGRRPPFINCAACIHTHRAGEGRAAGRGVVGATHAAGAGGHFDGQAVGHRATLAGQLLAREIDAEAGAACAAARAGVLSHRRLLLPRPR